MRLISYSINIDEFQDGKHTPAMKYSGVYPSEAFKTPRDLLQSIAEFLNEEFDLRLVVKERKTLDDLVPFDKFFGNDTESNIVDLDTVQARKERISKNKKELGYE